MTPFQAYAAGYQSGHGGGPAIVFIELALISMWRCGWSDGAMDQRLAGRISMPLLELQVAVAIDRNRCRKDVA